MDQQERVLTRQKHQQDQIQIPHYNEQSNQYSDWIQNTFNRERQRIIQNGPLTLLSSDTNSGSTKKIQSYCQQTISLSKLPQRQQSESELNYNMKLPKESQLFQGQPSETKIIEQNNFNEYKNQNLESIPQQKQRYFKKKSKSVSDQNKKSYKLDLSDKQNQQDWIYQKIFKRILSIKEDIDNENSQIVKILQINQIWHKRKNNIFDQNIIQYKKRNIILNKKNKKKQLNLSLTNVDVQMLKLIINYLEQLQKLKISECKLLNYLQLSFLSRLKNIDVSNSPIKTVKLSQLQNLQSIQAFECDCLSEITYDKCPKLVKINASNCSSLVSLNSQHLQQLQKINLFFCANFIWDSIQKCRNLYYFYALGTTISTETANKILQNNPKLEQINLNNCFQIKKILHLKNNKSIINLRIVNGYFSQLNLHKLNKLKALELSNLNNLERLIVKQCQNLRSLKFKNLCIKYIQLQDNPSIQQIKFQQCFIKDQNNFK